MRDMKKCKKFRQVILIPKFFVALFFSIISYSMQKSSKPFHDGGSQKAVVYISINAFSNREFLLMLRINIG